jgi:hypothetical protein
MTFFIGLVIGILIGVLALATICGIANSMMRQRAPSRMSSGRNKAAMIREKNRIMEIHRNSGW